MNLLVPTKIANLLKKIGLVGTQLSAAREQQKLQIAYLTS